jgi:hypothetical protein
MSRRFPIIGLLLLIALHTARIHIGFHKFAMGVSKFLPLLLHHLFNVASYGAGRGVGDIST